MALCLSALVLAQAARGQTSADQDAAAAPTNSAAAVAAQAAAIVDAKPSGGVRLVDADRELRDTFEKIVEDIRDRRFEKVVEALHTLITADTAVFYPMKDDGRRHFSGADAAEQLLGILPREALVLYNRMYGPAAQRLFEQARAETNEAMLRRTARQYFHTVAGARAANLAATLASDRGAFLDAARTWESLCLAHGLTDLDRPLLLTKAAVAYHLARCPARAAALANLLATRYARARAVIAGRETDLLSFASRALSEPPAAIPPPAPAAAWPSPYGAADGAAVMRGCTVSPFVLWREPESRRMTNVLDMLHLAPDDAPRQESVRITAAIEGGRARATVHSPGQNPYAIEMPAAVHPVVLGDLIICRREEAITATSAATGEEAWRFVDLPLHRRVTGGKTLNHYLPLAGDMGRYTLSAADDRLFAVGNLRRIDPDTYRRSAGTPTEEGSTLAAVSLADRKILWHVGNGAGQDDVARTAKFLTAPAYHDGRLFVLAKLGNRYLMVCLDAATGKGVWNMSIGPIPTHTGEQRSWQAAYTMELMTERASLPSVSGGRVHFTSNSGLVGALDEHTGLPLWAYRYDSRLSGAAEALAVKDVAYLAFLISAARTPFQPQNPIVVVNGRVICLPCDSEQLLALNAGTGELMWKCDRRGLRDLSYVDEERVLLSGPGFMFVGVADGREIKRIDAQVADRPAVTPRAAVAAGPGRLVQVDLADYSVREQTVSDPQVLLGNLLTVGDRLVAANGAGVNLFFGFDEAWTTLAGQIEQERDPAKKADAQFQRAMLALQTGRHDAALQDLRAAHAAARRTGNAEAAGRAGSWLYRTLLSRAATAAKDDAAGRLLDEALQYADGPRQTAAVLLRRIRHHEEAGSFAKSAEVAQSIADNCADAWMPAPGGGAGGGMTGYALGHAEIARLIREHGRSAYDAFDRRFAAAFGEAKRQSDVAAMLGAQRRWPMAEAAPELLFAAAEQLYRQAISNAPPDNALAARASRVLGEIRNYPGSPLLPAARAAQALIDSRFRTALGQARIREIKSLPADLSVRFADFRGTAQDIVRRLEGIVVPLPAPPESFASLAGPVSPVLRFPAARLTVLRDQTGWPVAAGETVFLHDEGTLFAYDTQIGDASAGRLWSAQLPRQLEPWRRTGYMDGDRGLVAVADADGVVVVDALSGKETIRKEPGDLGIGAFAAAAGDGCRIVISDRGGQLACLNMATGEREWHRPSRDLPAKALQASSDVVYAGDAARENALFLDIRSGRELHRFRGAMGGMTTAMNCDGFGVALRAYERAIEFVDPRRPDARPTRNWPFAKSNQHILGFGSRFLALRDRGQPNVLSFADIAAQPQTNVHALVVLDAQGRPMPVFHLVLADAAGYAVCAASANSQEQAKSPVLVAVDLATAKEMWRTVLHSAEDGWASVSLPQVFGNVLSVAVTPAGGEGTASRCLAFDAQSGAPLMDFSPGQAGLSVAPADGAPDRALRRAGSPVILNGRAILETDGGVLCVRTPL